MSSGCSWSGRRLVIALALTAWPGLFYAQQHWNGWFRLTARYAVNDRVQADMELQHRRQSSYNDRAPMDHNLMFSVRPWLYYQLDEDVQLAASPLAWYRLHPVIEKPADVHAGYLTEYRTTFGVSMKRRLDNNFTIGSRFMIEYRNFNRSADIIRARARIGLDVRLNRRYKLNIQEELLANLHGAPASHYFDHNRVGASVTRMCKGNAWAELGYVYINRLLPRNTDAITEHNVFLHVGISFSRREFKKD